MASRKSDIGSLNYSKAFSVLGSKQNVRINHNTYLEKVSDETIVVRLYATQIVKFHSDGSIQLNTGGYDTVTTVARINDSIMGASVFIRKGDLLVSVSGTEYTFENNMTIFEDGTTDATPFAVQEIGEVADVPITSMEDVARYVKGLPLKAIKTLWRKCKYSRDRIAYYAMLEFIPLIIPCASGNEYWYKTAADRLANG